MSKMIEEALRASVDQYVMLQPRPGVAFNIPTVAPGDNVSFDDEHPFPATTVVQDERGRQQTQMIQIPILMGKLVERRGALWLRTMDEAGNSGKYLLIAIDPDAIVAISLLADPSTDAPRSVAPVPTREPSRIVLPG